MARQFLELRKDEPIVIETPEGLIRISRSQHPRQRRKLVLDLPGECRAYVGQARALEHARFVHQREDGELEADYSVLVPVTGPDGQLTGVRPQRPLRLSGTPASAAPLRVAQA